MTMLRALLARVAGFFDVDLGWLDREPRDPNDLDTPTW